MTSSKHTPGPWFYSQESIDHDWYIVTINGGLIVANVNSHWRQVANARLIAAAPDLLEALKEINGIVEHAQQIVGATLPSDGMSEKDAIAELLLLLDGQDQRRIQGAARAAIAKAEDAP